MPFDGDDAISRIFSHDPNDIENHTVFLFYKEEGPHNQVFENVAKEMNNVAIFSSALYSSDYGQSLAEELDVNKKDLPAIRGMLGSTMDRKFKFTGDLLSEDVVKKWIDDLIANRIEKFVKSEPVPVEDTGLVKNIVGLNFDEVVKKSGKDVQVFFYAPWCTHCKAFKKPYKQVAKELNYLNEKIIIAKSDATKNEYIGEEELEGYPTLRQYQNGKPEKPVEFKGKRNAKSLKQWILKNVSFDPQEFENKSTSQSEESVKTDL